MNKSVMENPAYKKALEEVEKAIEPLPSGEALSLLTSALATHITNSCFDSDMDWAKVKQVTESVCKVLTLAITNAEKVYNALKSVQKSNTSSK
ncbi:hypothetical protein [Muribaculum intestinale]|jgi:hypothetical protein|uniref:hypothetical protein n=1 Tax=Muribaculum intestinale TaxID=1796646 RepID=UPI0025B5F8B5|nr:hypothetical protein [Muribaculum intestinale]